MEKKDGGGRGLLIVRFFSDAPRLLFGHLRVLVHDVINLWYKAHNLNDIEHNA